MTDLEPLVNKTVAFKFHGAELRLDLTHALFSSYDVDLGTRLLLKVVGRDPALAAARRVLDEGCGTGAIGLCVAKAFPEACVHLRDRDSLAVAFSERNRLSNRIKGRTAWKDPATGEERQALPAPHVSWGIMAGGGEGGPFDYVLSNLPAKAGAPVLAAFFIKLPSLLAPGGRAGFVIVNSLAEAAASWIAKAGLRVVATEQGSGHRVYIVSDGAEPQAVADPAGAATVDDSAAPITALDLGSYRRCESRFKVGGLNYGAWGYWGLPDFDVVGYGSALAIEVASRACAGILAREILILNPGIGHLAIWAAKTLGPEGICAASRDLLSLAATGANLSSLSGRSKPAYRAFDALRLDALEGASFDFIAEVPDIVPEYDWIAPAWARAARLAKSGATYLAVCPPTEMTRFEKRRPAGWRLLVEKRRKGFACSAWRRT